MAGARPSSFKKGGGFLDGVDSIITGYRFTDDFNNEPFKAGKMKDSKTGKLVDKPHTLNFILSVRVEGADEDTFTTLKVAGDFDQWVVSDDGLTIEPATEGGNLAGGTSFAKFIGSLCAASPELEARLPEDAINYEAIIGTRLRTVQRVDAERTQKFGKKIDKKTGKGYDRKDLVVDQVYELPEVGGSAAKPAAKAATKAAPKAAASKTTKVAPAAQVEETQDIDAISTDAVLTILGKVKDGRLEKNKFSMKVLTEYNKHPQREDIRQWIHNDDNLVALAEGGLISYDKTTKIVALPAAA